MMNYVEVTGYEVQEDKVLIIANDIEKVLTTIDLPEDYVIPELIFEFNRTDENNNMLYLYKLLRSNNKCKKANSIGEMLNLIVGSAVRINSSFIKKAA